MIDSSFRQFWLGFSGSSIETALAKLAQFDLPGILYERASKWVIYGAELGLESDAFLGDDGEVAVSFYNDDSSVELIFELNGSASVHVERGVGFEFDDVRVIESATIVQIAQELNELSRYNEMDTRLNEWNSSGSLNLIGGTSENRDSQTWDSNLQLA